MSALHDVRAFVRRPWGSVLAGAVAVTVVAGVGLLAAPDAVPVVAEPVVEPVASAELLCPITVATSALVTTVSAGVAPVPEWRPGARSSRRSRPPRTRHRR